MAYPSDRDIMKLLANDSLANAEKLTGKSYKEDEGTSNIGFLMNVHDNIVRERALTAIGDTVFSMDWLAYCEMIEKFGFGLMVEDFSPGGGESIRLYYHEKDGLLLITDSFRGNRNSASVHYNWMPKIRPKEDWANPEVAEFVDYCGATSSGGFEYIAETDNPFPKNKLDPDWKNVVYVGNHDAREAVGFKMRRLRENGTFIPVWKKKPYMWLVAHWEKDQKDNYDQINSNRIAKLPQWVQDNIKGE